MKNSIAILCNSNRDFDDGRHGGMGRWDKKLSLRGVSILIEICRYFFEVFYAVDVVHDARDVG